MNCNPQHFLVDLFIAVNGISNSETILYVLQVPRQFTGESIVSTDGAETLRTSVCIYLHASHLQNERLTQSG